MFVVTHFKTRGDCHETRRSIVSMRARVMLGRAGGSRRDGFAGRPCGARSERRGTGVR